MKSAEASAKSSRSGLFPTVDLSLSRYYTYGDEYSRSQSGAKTDIDGNLGHSDAFQLAVNYTVFNGFGDISAYRADKALVESSRANYRSERQSLVAEVLSAYLSAVMAKASVELSDSNLSVSLSKRELFRARLEAGSVTRLDFLSAQMDFASDSVRNISLRSERAASLRSLDELLGGGAVSSDSELSDSVEVDRNPYWKSPEGLSSAKSRAAENNAELFAAKASLDYAKAKRPASTSSLYPKLDLHGSLNATAGASDKGYCKRNYTKERYEVKIDDTLSAIELVEDWNIIDVRGSILVLERKEVDGE